MSRFAARFLIVLCLSVFGSSPFAATAASENPTSTYKASSPYSVAPGAGATPAAFATATAAKQPAASTLTALNAALRAADQRRHVLSSQDAHAFADAVHGADVDPASAVHLSEIKRKMANAQQRHAPASQVSALRTAQLSAQRYHPKFVCAPGLPKIFETSVGGEDDPAVTLPANTIQPDDVLSIYGCNFGSAAGSVSIFLTKSNLKLPLGLDQDFPEPWSDALITVDLYELAAVPDQPATLTVTSASGATVSFALNFVAIRSVREITADHGNVIAVNHACAHAATDDACGADPVGNKKFPTGRTFVDVHYKVCCKSTDSTDIYYLKLTNGFTIPKLDPYAATLGQNAVDGNVYDPGSGVNLLGTTGGTTCNFFGHNHAGHLKGIASGASSVPGFNAQIAFSWHVGRTL